MVNISPVRHNRLNEVDVSMTANRLFTGLSPGIVDGLNKVRMVVGGEDAHLPAGSATAVIGTYDFDAQ